MDALHDFLYGVIDIAAMILATLVLLGLVTVAVLYIVDVNQSEQAIRRNYPVIGRLRYFFEHMGVFFRQYFFAMDREELPFNRAQRSWIARAAKNIDSTVAFGSTKPIRTPGQILFLNSMLPKLDSEAENLDRKPITFGEGYARRPYSTYSVFPYLRHELRRAVGTRDQRLVARRRRSRNFVQHRRGRALPLSPRGWL